MSNTEIKVSVIMPIYNAYDYLRPALDSVIDQTLREIEIICIDDGSTDHTLDIIKEYQAQDARIRIVTENNAGVSTARNKGIIRARGEYTAFLDADDFFEPTLLEKLYERAKKDDLDIAVCLFDIYNNKESKFTRAISEADGVIFDGGKVASASEHPDRILGSTTGYVWNKLFRTSLIKEKELTFAPELNVFEDVHFVCSALALAGSVARIDEVLVHHRVYTDQSRSKLFKKYYAQVPVVYLKIKEFLMQKGMYIPLFHSYLNLSATRCYKIYNLLWSDAKADFWNMLHDGYADSLGWFRCGSDEFNDREVAEFVANVGIYSHRLYEKRTDRGRSIKVEGMSEKRIKKRLKKVHFREKLRELIGKLKGKKKK